jgi:hypothetical protein
VLGAYCEAIPAGHILGLVGNSNGVSRWVLCRPEPVFLPKPPTQHPRSVSSGKAFRRMYRYCLVKGLVPLR